MTETSLWHRIRSVMLSATTALPVSATPLPALAGGASLPGTVVSQLNPAPKIVILTSELGHGHSRAALALRIALQQQCPGAKVTILDWWSLLNEEVAAIIKQMYLRVVQQHPQLYEELYQLNERTWRDMLAKPANLPPACVQLLGLIAQMYGEMAGSPPAKGRYLADRAVFGFVCSGASEQASLAGGLRARMALVKWNWSRLVRRLGNAIDALVPDAVICTQMIPGALFAQVKQQRHLSIPSIAVPTDFGVHDFWRHAETDLYCVGHESLLSSAWLQNRKRANATGFALMPQFSNQQTEAAARLELGLSLHQPVVLVLGGGLGLGVDVVAQTLLNAGLNAQLLVLCGNNSPARAALTQLAQTYPRQLQVLDWTDNVATYMRAADVVVGKPGGLSVAETLACGRPFLATRSLGGQEGFNVRFIQAFGVGALLTDAELVTRLRCLLQHPAEIDALKQRASHLVGRDGARRIASRVLGLIAEHAEQHAARPALRIKESSTWRYGHDI